MGNPNQKEKLKDKILKGLWGIFIILIPTLIGSFSDVLNINDQLGCYRSGKDVSITESSNKDQDNSIVSNNISESATYSE